MLIFPALPVLFLSELLTIFEPSSRKKFALMLMSVLIKRLREAIADTHSLGLLTDNKVINSVCVFDSKMMRELTNSLDDSAVTHIRAQQTIFRKGGIGTIMYVILSGYVIAGVDRKVIERSGPGCVIGEVALIDQKHRMARVISETDCTLLAINRHVFMELVNTQPFFSLGLLKAMASRLRFLRTGEAI